jgi:hypothetical protein
MKKKLFNTCTGTLLIALSFFTANCNKEKVQPTSDPSTLNNQLVCKVDGKEWKSTQVLYSGFYDYSPSFNRRYLYLHFVNGRQEINIFLNPPYNKASYTIDKNTTTYPTANYPENYLSLEKYYDNLTPEKICITGNSSIGKIEFTELDSVKHIVKGKFSFTGEDKRTGNAAVVTEGYFDFHE